MTEYNGDVYEGPWQNDKKQGKFTVTRRGQQPVEEEYSYVTDANGDVFEGRVLNGKRHHGNLTYKIDGIVYTGPFINDLPEGEKGQQVWPNGTIYRGPIVAGKMHGEGIQEVKRNDGIMKFKCTWEYGNPTKGIVTYPTGQTCEGPFKNNHPEGQCVYKWPNGAHYEGDFVGGGIGRHGKGKMTEHFGDVYDGEWQNDKRHGDGTLTLKDGTTYTGPWNEGKKHGKFTVIRLGQQAVEEEYDQDKLVAKPPSASS
jgi:hypothetical protein